MDESKLIGHKRYKLQEKPISEIEEVVKLGQDSYFIIKQRSPAWLYVRDQKSEGVVHRYGASDLSNLLGFFTPETRKYFKDKNWESYTNEEFKQALKIPGKSTKKTFTPDIQIKLDWGTRKEANAVYYILEKLESVDIYETGSYVLKVPGEKFEFLVSPDGIIIDHNSKLNATLEVKAPCPFILDDCKECEGCKKMEKCNKPCYAYRMKYPYKDLPVYYVAQTQFQMKAAEKQMGVFASYTVTKGTSIRLIERNDDFINLCIKAISWAYKTYITEKKEVPKKASPYEGFTEYGLLLASAAALSTICIGEKILIDNISGVELTNETMWLDKSNGVKREIDQVLTENTIDKIESSDKQAEKKVKKDIVDLTIE